MPEAIEIMFRGRRLDYYVNPDRVPLSAGDQVVVESDRGIDLGEIRHLAVPVELTEKRPRFKSILRRASERDLRTRERQHEDDRNAVGVCKDLIRRLRLDMKLIDAESQLDGNLMTFYFTAEQRVDFRELVKELATVFKTRIELRQIGARDAAKRIGGIGPCGREYCCSTWLKDFSPVTLKMAKNQGLALAPAKISGGCGRLMCCLMYEDPFYKEMVKLFPKQGSRFVIEGIEYQVVANDFFREVIRLRDREGNSREYPVEEFPIPREDWKGGVRAKGAPSRGGHGSGCHKPDPQPIGMKNARGRREDERGREDRPRPDRGREKRKKIPLEKAPGFEGAPLLRKGEGKPARPSPSASGECAPEPQEMVRFEARKRRERDGGEIGSGVDRTTHDLSDAELVASSDPPGGTSPGSGDARDQGRRRDPNDSDVREGADARGADAREGRPEGEGRRRRRRRRRRGRGEGAEASGEPTAARPEGPGADRPPRGGEAPPEGEGRHGRRRRRRRDGSGRPEGPSDRSDRPSRD